jgi:glyoxylase-like metal-dependent hydrolase (beta-lactamase superfamily II)
MQTPSILRQYKISDQVTVFYGHYDSPTDYLKGNVTATVVYDAKDAFVFDSLWFPADTKEMLRKIKSRGLNIIGLVNTHWHWDHTAGNQLFVPDTRRVTSSYECRGCGYGDDMGTVVTLDGPEKVGPNLT